MSGAPGDRKPVGERRGFKRYPVEGMQIGCKMLYSSEARLANVSVGGALIHVTKRLHIGQEYVLTLGGGDSAITLKATVTRERLAGFEKNEKEESVPRYEVGLQFENVLTGEGARLIDFIQNSPGVRKLNVRLRGTRVEMGRPETATVEGAYDFCQVKKIGLGGLLLETPARMETDGQFHLQMCLAEEGGEISFLGRVAASREIPGKKPPLYETGIHILHIAERDRKVLQAFVNSLKANGDTAGG
jgi:hypothetical protein